MLGVTKRSELSGDVELVDWPEPKARPDHVVLKVHAVGICGTDLHIFRNEYQVSPPVIMGHEVCGTVVELGKGVDKALLGKRFVAETFFETCQQCNHCRNGRPNLCVSRKSIGSHVNGAMTTLVELPVRNLHSVPDKMSDQAASLAEPVACVANSMFGRSSYVEPGFRSLVIGPGAIGLIAAQVAAVQGSEVMVRGTPADKPRLELAKKLGFEISDTDKAMPEETFDFVIECSGNSHGYADAIRFAARGGHVAQMGLSGKPATLPVDLICYKELKITSGFASTPQSWRRAMRLLTSGGLDLESIITDTLPLKSWKTGFDRSFAADGIKFVLSPN